MSKLLSMLKYSFLRSLPMNYENNGFGYITLNVNFQGRNPFSYNLTQFNYLCTNYLITVVFNLLYLFSPCG